MPRPRKEGLDYFPHDVDASNDEKIEIMTTLYGNDGYAFYFILLERIYRTPNLELSVSDAETIQILAKKTNVSVEKFTQMLDTALKYGLFDKQAFEERKVLTSNGIKKRAAIVLEKRAKMREKYKTKNKISAAETGEEIKEETRVSAAKIEEEKGVEMTQSKEKKINNIKEKKINNIVVVDDINNTQQQQQQIYDQDLKELTEFFSKNIHPITLVEYEDLQKWLKEGIPKEVIKEAIMEAVRYNKRYIGYVNKILITWNELGLKTIDAVQAHLRDWQDARELKKQKADIKPASWQTKTITDTALEDWEKQLLENTYQEVKTDV